MAKGLHYQQAMPSVRAEIILSILCAIASDISMKKLHKKLDIPLRNARAFATAARFMVTNGSMLSPTAQHSSVMFHRSAILRAMCVQCISMARSSRAL
eukprot:20493-Heterococcus_DN1.PRE.1